MDRADAEAIALAGGEPARELLIALVERVEELERSLNRTSRNSSVAPSSDPPLTRQQRRALARERAKKQLQREGRQRREQGAQPGHEGSSRPPAEPERLTAAPVDCLPGRCGCGHHFTGDEQRVGESVCHQQWELPAIVAEVRGWRRLRLECPGCGRSALAGLPQGVSGSMFGPRLHAHVAVLAGVHRLSREKIVELLGECYGIELSTGAVDMMLRRVSRVLHDPWRELAEAIKLAEAVHADETTWLCKADPCWLWTATTAALVCYRIDPRRTQEAAKRLLGENFGGFVTSDRYVGYHWLDVLQQQLCWAHAVRQLTDISERPGAPGKLGTRLLDIAGEVFQIHREHAPQLAAGDDPEHPALLVLREALAPLRERFRGLLEQGTRGRHPKTARFCAGLLNEYEALWTFCDVPGVSPTNNDAERAMRGPVILRRISGGIQSERGNPPHPRLADATPLALVCAGGKPQDFERLLGVSLNAAQPVDDLVLSTRIEVPPGEWLLWPDRAWALWIGASADAQSSPVRRFLVVVSSTTSSSWSTRSRRWASGAAMPPCSPLTAGVVRTERMPCSRFSSPVRRPL